jgi:hypothetical protein
MIIYMHSLKVGWQHDAVMKPHTAAHALQAASNQATCAAHFWLAVALVAHELDHT